jgi:cyanate permease
MFETNLTDVPSNVWLLDVSAKTHVSKSMQGFLTTLPLNE